MVVPGATVGVAVAVNSCWGAALWTWLCKETGGTPGRAASGRPGSDCAVLPGGVPAEIKAGAADTGCPNPLPTRPTGTYHPVTLNGLRLLSGQSLPGALMQACSLPSPAPICCGRWKAGKRCFLRAAGDRGTSSSTAGTRLLEPANSSTETTADPPPGAPAVPLPPHAPLTCGEASRRAGIAQHRGRAELRWGWGRKTLGQEGPRQRLEGGLGRWFLLDSRPRGEGRHGRVHLQGSGCRLGRGQGWGCRLGPPQEAFKWGAHRGRRWGQAARGAGIWTGGLCAPCSAPSVGRVEQAREVAVLVVDELKHVCGKEEKLCEQQRGRCHRFARSPHPHPTVYLWDQRHGNRKPPPGAPTHRHL